MRKNLFIVLPMLLILFSTAVSGNNNDIKYKVSEGVWIKMNRFFVTSLPGQQLTLKLKSESHATIVSKADFGNISHMEHGKLVLKVPDKKGIYNILFTTPGNKFTLVLIVLVPSTEMKGEYLNGYRIGHYPDKLLKGNKIYKKPEGFIEVTSENKNTYITPHFQLKQFLCKQQSGWPKYIILQPKLLVKLEYLLTALNEDGRNIKTLFIMSGYRTPYYNKSLGNVKFSRHVYGDAADVYVDENHDGVMDDLNHDGKHDMDDEMVIYKIVKSFDTDPKYKALIGGIGKYKKNSRHTYFIHIDTRGYIARW